MATFFHCASCRLSVVALALALFSCFCVQAPPPPPPHCNLRWLSSNVHFDENIQKQGSLFTLSFLANHSFSFTFTTSYSDQNPAPTLAFIILVSSIESASASSIESASACTAEHFTISHSLDPDGCDPHSQIQVTSSPNCSSESHPDDPDEPHLNYELSLTYNAIATSLQVQDADCSDGLPCNNGLPLDEFNETITLYVGFITSGEASINVNTTEFFPSSGKFMPSDGIDHHSNAKSKHIQVVVWVIVGVSMMGLLIGFLIIVLFIKKHRRRPSLVTSRPAAHPLATTRAPFYHHDLESSPTPMMKALPLSPPYNDTFQISGTASWLKQPNPR